MASTPEGKVKDACKKFLKARGIFFFMPVSNGMGQVGIPDIICCYKGLFVAIETKAPGKRANLTDNQKRIMENIRDSEGFAFVVDDPSELDFLFKTIDAYLKIL